MEGKNLFALNNQTKIFYFLSKKRKHEKKAETETKKEKYKEKGVNFEGRVYIFEKSCR